jgi:hypothetical protein
MNMTIDHDARNAIIEERKLRYVEIMKEFLEYKEWNDGFDLKEEICQVFLETGLTVGHQSGRLFIEMNYDSELTDVYLYYNFHCRENKRDEVVKLINHLHLRWAPGRFELLPDGRVRWRHRVDFEGSSPSGVSIARIVDPGWDCTVMFVDVVVAVGMTNQTAEEALAEFDAARAKAKEADDDDAPSEL